MCVRLFMGFNLLPFGVWFACKRGTVPSSTTEYFLRDCGADYRWIMKLIMQRNDFVL